MAEYGNSSFNFLFYNKSSVCPEERAELCFRAKFRLQKSAMVENHEKKGPKGNEQFTLRFAELQNWQNEHGRVSKLLQKKN